MKSHDILVNTNSLVEFLNAKKYFSFSEFEEIFRRTYSETKEFPIRNDENILRIVDGIVGYYSQLLADEKEESKKEILIIKIVQLIRRINAGASFNLNFGFRQDFDPYKIELLFIMLVDRLSNIGGEDVHKSNGTSTEKAKGDFKAVELISFIHVLRKAGFFIPGMSSQKIVVAFQELTGTKFGSIINRLSEDKFFEDKGIVHSKGKLKSRLKEMITYLESER